MTKAYSPGTKVRTTANVIAYPHRTGTIVGDEKGDVLPTGATYIPVRWDDDQTVVHLDVRIVEIAPN